ncbi:MAG: hypothetical protein ABI162_02520, partial [Luteolibacter sp.]
FKPASYTLEFTKKGSTPQTIQINAAVDGWFFGNLLIGGPIGMLVVDPVTGAMWKLDGNVNANLTSVATLKIGNGHSLNVVDRAAVPQRWKSTWSRSTNRISPPSGIPPNPGRHSRPGFFIGRKRPGIH